MITVGKKSDKDAIYIGRSSPLGNPFRVKNNSDKERDRVCDAYEMWIADKIKQLNPVVCSELRRLYELSKKGDLTLGCFCSPKRCHGDTIKRILETGN